ncbi:thioesterase [Photobacterium marinum]|uniref:Thioesterase n=1 Tax=Photobacterium marinum TaxID=1056511 RepID=L8JH10_9GAMM|nr:alpha/beta fold hydrolase [Photobacterium marinum]ELR66774.1 thioesterase [Photobacterium marinum]
MSNKWIPFPSTKKAAKIDLLCLPYAGGNASIYRQWDSFMPEWIAVQPIELPGHGSRICEDLIVSVEALTKQVFADVLAKQQRPFALLGHSMGAGLAFHLSDYAAQRGVNTQALFVSGRQAPVIGKGIRPRFNLSDAELIEELKFLNGSPPEVLENEELMSFLLPIIRADFSLSEWLLRNDVNTKTSVPIRVIGARNDIEVDYKKLHLWRENASQEIKISLMEGEHFFIHDCEKSLSNLIASDLKLMMNEPQVLY